MDKANAVQNVRSAFIIKPSAAKRAQKALPFYTQNHTHHIKSDMRDLHSVCL